MQKININLLPPEIKLSHEQQLRRRRFLAIMGFALVILLVINCALLITNLQARGELKRLSEQRQALDDEMIVLAPYMKQKELVQQTDLIIKKAIAEPPDWASMLTDIGRYIPQNVWITDFSAVYRSSDILINENLSGKQQTLAEGNNQNVAEIQQNDNNNKQTPVSTSELTILGYAKDNASVAGWLEEMHKISGLSSISCQFSSEESMDGLLSVHFEIRAKI